MLWFLKLGVPVRKTGEVIHSLFLMTKIARFISFAFLRESQSDSLIPTQICQLSKSCQILVNDTALFNQIISIMTCGSKDTQNRNKAKLMTF